MTVHVTKHEDDGDFERMASVLGPGQIDQTVRHAIHYCWMSLPKERKSVDEVERQIRRVMERALKDFRDDAAEFGCTLDETK